MRDSEGINTLLHFSKSAFNILGGMILYKKIFHFYNQQMKAVYLLFIVTIFFSRSVLAVECDLGSPVKVFHPQYARHFKISYYPNFKIINVDDQQYLLSTAKGPGCEINKLKITTPVKKVVMMSTTYLPALHMLRQEKSLIGFQGKRYIVSKSFDLNQIKEVAYKFNPEYLLGLNSDLIMGYDSNLTGKNQHRLFLSLKIPVVINKDFEETSPLARAEWLIFISSFYDQEERAHEIFNSIKESYFKIKKRNLKIAKKAKVLVGEIQNGFWVTCGGKSDLAQLIEDAGGELAMKSSSSNTQQISLEELGQKKDLYDVWLTHNLWASHEDLTKAMNKDKRYSLITAKNIYNNNLISNADKYTDYWETGLQRPDLLLLDLSAIFHPEEYKEHVSRWYRRL